MIEQDTIRLLRECDAGIQMGVSSIAEVLPYVNGKALKEMLQECKRRHERMAKDLEKQLNRYDDEGKAPNPMAKAMSWVKTNAKLAADTSDATIADLMTDGCNMGVKSLHRYINQYQAADAEAKDMAKQIAAMEEKLMVEIRPYL